MLNKWFIHLVTLSANKPQCPFQFILKLGRHFLGAKIIFSSFDFWNRRTILIETSFCHASKLKLSTILLKDKSKKILDDSNFLFPLYVHSRFDWTFLNTLECEGNYWCVYLIFICASSPNSFLFMPNIAAKSSFTVSCP